MKPVPSTKRQKSSRMLIIFLAMVFAFQPRAEANPVMNGLRGLRELCTSNPTLCAAIGVTLGAIIVTNTNCVVTRRTARNQCNARKQFWSRPEMQQTLRNPAILRQLDRDIAGFSRHINAIVEPEEEAQTDPNAEQNLQGWVTGMGRETMRQGGRLVNRTARGACSLYENNINNCAGELALIRMQHAPAEGQPGQQPQTPPRTVAGQP